MSLLSSVEYAALHSIYERFLKCGSSVALLSQSRSEFSALERAEWRQFKRSEFFVVENFDGYCESREADTVWIQKLIHSGAYQLPKTARKGKSAQKWSPVKASADPVESFSQR